MKKSLLFIAFLLTSSVGFTATMTLTDQIDIMTFLMKNPEALNVPSACTATVGAVCKVTSIVVHDCVTTSVGNQRNIKLTLKNNVVADGESNLSIACPSSY